MPSWRGAQLKHRDNLHTYLFTYLLTYLLTYLHPRDVNLERRGIFNNQHIENTNIFDMAVSVANTEIHGVAMKFQE
jgi:hypothetical protein